MTRFELAKSPIISRLLFPQATFYIMDVLYPKAYLLRCISVIHQLCQVVLPFNIVFLW